MTHEVRRTIAHFLNGLAVATMAAGIIGPAVLGTFNWPIAASTIVLGVVLHAGAIWTSVSGR